MFPKKLRWRAKQILEQNLLNIKNDFSAWF